MSTPLFSKLGKDFSDLAKKKYDYVNQVKLVSKPAKGVSFEAVGKSTAKGIDGSQKFSFTFEPVGDLEFNTNTSGSLKAKVENGSLADGLNVTANVDDQLAGSLEAEFKQPNFSGHFHINSGLKLCASAVVGQDSFYVGAAGSYDGSKGQVTDYNAAAEYRGGDYNVTLATGNKCEEVKASYLHRLGSGTLVGSALAYNLASGSPNFILASQFKLDADTLMKAKVDSSGFAGFAVEHRLYNDNVKVNLATTCNLNGSNPLASEKFGIGLTFGDL